ncbi:MAG TPA: PfkB family carbohydrate kinase [Thermoleophilia bacterium]|nr:PfkB family carbohydrate kinase [Thermoleophilia bacterium]
MTTPGEVAGDERVAPPFDLLVAGDLNPDVVLTGVPPELGGDQSERLVAEAVLTVGGSAGIVACGAARLGLRTALASIVGDDDAGSYVRSALAARQVDVGGVVVRDEQATGLSVSLVGPARGDRAILTAPGSIALFEAAMIDGTLLRRARHLHVTSFFLQPRLATGIRALLDEARASGLSTSLDCNDDPAGRWDGLLAVLPAVDILFANRREAMALTGGSGGLEPALARLASTGTLPVVKLGDAGAVAWSSGTTTSVPAFPVEVRDTVGAGDGFAAGFLCAWLETRDLARSLAFGAACGSLSTRALGGVEAQATRAEASAAAEWLLSGAALEGAT